MKVFFININGILPEHMELISPERAEKAMRFRYPEDRKRCVAGGLLLRKLLGDAAVFTDMFGKPRCENGAFFNLSHSGDWVILASGDTEVGCDIERHRQADELRLGKIVFTDNELELLQNSYDRLGDFYRLWTKKEALLKCMGKGFHRAAKTVDVCADTFCEDGDIYRMNTIVFADYTVSVCAQNGSAEIETEIVRV